MFSVEGLFAKFEALGKKGDTGDRSTVESCFTPVLGEILTAWILDKHPPLTKEIDNLFAALKNPKDPMLQELDLIMRQAVVMGVKSIQKQKENVLRQLKEQNQNGNENQGQG